MSTRHKFYSRRLHTICGIARAINLRLLVQSMVCVFFDHCRLTVVDSEDPPVRQLSYSLTKTLFKISAILPTLEIKAQEAFLDLLGKIRCAFHSATSTQGSHAYHSVDINHRRQTTIPSHVLSPGCLRFRNPIHDDLILNLHIQTLQHYQFHPRQPHSHWHGIPFIVRQHRRYPS